MRVFIIGTGRCGTTTIWKAAQHITNYTAGHETKPGVIGRYKGYPDNHIESDGHLIWTVPRLVAKYPDAKFAVLRRDRKDLIDSLARRYYMQGILRLFHADKRHKEKQAREEAAAWLVDCMYAYAERFLAAQFKCDFRIFNLEKMKTGDWVRFWDWIGAEGDFDKSLKEWDIKHNTKVGDCYE